MECGQILVAQQAMIFPAEGVDAVRNVSAIEVITHGVNGGGAAQARLQSFLLGLHHRSQRARQIRLPKNFARRRHMPSGKKHAHR